MEELAKFKFPTQEQFIVPMKKFIEHYTSPLFKNKKDAEIIPLASGYLINSFINNGEKNHHPYYLKMNIVNEGEELKIHFKNEGPPIYLEIKEEYDIDHEFQKAINEDRRLKNAINNFHYKNFGRNGQLFTLSFPINTSKKKNNPIKKTLREECQISIRPIQKGEEAKLSKLFYKVYGYNYINEFVYYPRILAKKIQDKELIPIVAVADNGDVVGHVALLRHNQNPIVYEAALGVVDPTIKSKGLFSRIFKKVMAKIDTLKNDYCLYDFVTNHDFSQKEVFKYESHSLCMNLGNQISETQAKLESLGIGKDAPDMDRYSVIIEVRPTTSQPFGEEIVLPINIGEMTEFLLSPLGLRWTPASRFFPLESKGEYKVVKNKSQKSVHFLFDRPGIDSLKRIKSEWKYYLKMSYQYACIDIPLFKPGLGQAYDFFTRNGFFLAGYFPYQYGNKLSLRLQSLGHTRVSLDNIKVFNPTSKKLFELVKTQYLRQSQ